MSAARSSTRRFRPRGCTSAPDRRLQPPACLRRTAGPGVKSDNLQKLRESFLFYLSERLKGKRVTVVFDAKGETLQPSSYQDIRVKFVGNADQAILDQVSEDKEVRTVVSSDGALLRFLKPFKVRVVTSQEFLTQLEGQEAAEPDASEKLKTSTPSDAEVLYWVKRFTEAPPRKD